MKVSQNCRYQTPKESNSLSEHQKDKQKTKQKPSTLKKLCYV